MQPERLDNIELHGMQSLLSCGSSVTMASQDVITTAIKSKGPINESLQVVLAELQKQKLATD
eukprot:8208644-Karenia_brevis.AAC.1